MSRDVQSWLDSGDYLPAPLRDFHDQKDVFKCVGEVLERYKKNVPQNPAIQGMSWIDLHQVTIDVFLWWMAKRGYTLQRSRAALPFLDLNEDIAQYKTRQAPILREALKPKAQHGGGVG